MKKVRRHGENMSSQGFGDAYFIQKRAKSMGGGCAIPKWFADLMYFPKKSESAEILSNNKKM